MALSKHLLFNLDSSLPVNLYFKEGDVRFAAFPFHFSCFGVLFMKYKGANFA